VRLEEFSIATLSLSTPNPESANIAEGNSWGCPEEGFARMLAEQKRGFCENENSKANQLRQVKRR